MGYDVVLSLMEEYLSQGYSLYIDNFYTSPTLVYDLYQKGVHVTGTLDCSRIGVPSEIRDLIKEYAKAKVSHGDGAYTRDMESKCFLSGGIQNAFVLCPVNTLVILRPQLREISRTRMGNRVERMFRFLQ